MKWVLCVKQELVILNTKVHDNGDTKVVLRILLFDSLLSCELLLFW